MRYRKTVGTMLIGALAMSPLTGCESLPGDEPTQGAVIGGAGGAAAGAAIGGEDNRLGGALIGGLLGAGGGYLIGREMGKDDDEEAVQAAEKAQKDPATAQDARGAETADLNDDGFVTLDEVVALEEADLSDRQIINRLEATQQIFQLSEAQEEFLREQGISREVIVAMRDMNQDLAQPAGDEIISD